LITLRAGAAPPSKEGDIRSDCLNVSTMKLNVVPPRTGLAWVRLGIRTFWRQPLALSGLFFMYTAVVMLIARIPVAGPLVAGLLVPAATLGLMAATAEADRGRFPHPTVMVSAFRAGRQRAKAMLVLGIVYTAGSLLITELGSLVPAAPLADASAPAQQQLDVRTLVTLALHTPLFLMLWFAPALVHWHGITPGKSLFFSAVACWRNFGALVVFGLAWMGVFLGVGTLLGVIAGIAGGAGAVTAVMLPTALLMTAMFSASLYFTFRDSFTADPPPGEDPPISDGASP
jgi:hypothetical protein